MKWKWLKKPIFEVLLKSEIKRLEEEKDQAFKKFIEEENRFKRTLKGEMYEFTKIKYERIDATLKYCYWLTGRR